MKFNIAEKIIGITMINMIKIRAMSNNIRKPTVSKQKMYELGQFTKEIQNKETIHINKIDNCVNCYKLKENNYKN